MSMQRLKHLSLLPMVVVALSGIAMQSPIASTLRPSASVQRVAPHMAAGKPQREIFGFALASSLSDPSVGYPTWNFTLLSTVAYFGLHVNDDGTFAGDNGWTTWNNAPLRTAFVNAAHASGAKVVLTIILQDFGANTPHMCAGLAHYTATVGYAVAQAKAQGVDGLNVDYEGLNGSCGTADPSWARHSFTNFTGALRAALPAGSYLSVDSYASAASDPLGFFDVPAIAPNVDSFFVMAYDLEYSNYRRAPLGCSSFCLGPTAPLTGYYYNDTSTAAQYAAAVGASKVILGVPYYGRKACVGAATANQYPNPASSVAADSYLDAAGEESYYLVKAGTYVSHRDANDPTGQERWDTWYNTQLNCTRELYYDDATSLGQKYNLVNQDNLRGVGIWTLNYGGGAPELWNALAASFSPVPGTPTNLSACAGAGWASVSWSPAPSSGGPVTSYTVTANPGGAKTTVAAGKTAATVSGLAPGTAYTLSVQASNGFGQGSAAVSSPVTPVAANTYAGYFSWYDLASPGMIADNIHLLNTGASASSGCLQLSGQQVIPFTVNAGQEAQLSFAHGSIGGPVAIAVSSGPPLIAWQRAQYYQSFSETWARPNSASTTTQYFPWYDLASPGTRAETIHITNLSGADTTGTIALPGVNPVPFSVPNGQDGYVSFPYGTIGGPVTVTSTQPVLATLRAWYYQSISEMPALHSANAGTVLYFPWYDLASAGTRADTIHIANTGASPATGSIALPHATSINFSVPPGHDGYYTFPGGTIGGPVKITSNQPVLATLRAWYYQSLNEVWARPASAAGSLLYYSLYDTNSPGMRADVIHITNVSGSAASGSITVPGATALHFIVPDGQDAYFAFPGGTVGRPITINSNQPVLASLRSWYYQSFNEVPSD
jgi:Glycosyl hydrolases family 18/Fibronectin type III domain